MIILMLELGVGFNIADKSFGNCLLWKTYSKSYSYFILKIERGHAAILSIRQRGCTGEDVFLQSRLILFPRSMAWRVLIHKNKSSKNLCSRLRPTVPVLDRLENAQGSK